MLVFISALNNYDLVFTQYADAFRNNAWNTSEMGEVIRNFTNVVGNEENAWVVAFPYWVDTRLVGINAGYPTRDTAIDPAHLDDTLNDAGAKMFLINTQDGNSLAHLQELYPEGRYWIYPSQVQTKEFVIFQFRRERISFRISFLSILSIIFFRLIVETNELEISLENRFTIDTGFQEW